MPNYVVLTSRTVRRPNLRAQFMSDELARAREFYETRVYDLKEITRRGGVVLACQTDAGTEVLESTWSSGAPEDIQEALRGVSLPRKGTRVAGSKHPRQLLLFCDDDREQE